VEGELLQFAEGSPVTQGARLGFMWASPGQRRFLVRPATFATHVRQHVARYAGVVGLVHRRPAK
jgi:hypothetical protein